MKITAQARLLFLFLFLFFFCFSFLGGKAVSSFSSVRWEFFLSFSLNFNSSWMPNLRLLRRTSPKDLLPEQAELLQLQMVCKPLCIHLCQSGITLEELILLKFIVYIKKWQPFKTDGTKMKFTFKEVCLSNFLQQLPKLTWNRYFDQAKRLPYMDIYLP